MPKENNNRGARPQIGSEGVVPGMEKDGGKDLPPDHSRRGEQNVIGGEGFSYASQGSLLERKRKRVLS